MLINFEDLKTNNPFEYIFKDKELLKTALTHSSYAAEHHCDDNERMEYLGDAVLELCVSEYLYENKPAMREGDMTKTRAKYVCESALFSCAVSLKLPEMLLLGANEDKAGGRNKPSILSDALESVIAAIFLDGGFFAARSFVREKLVPHLSENISKLVQLDYKTKFQEYAQSLIRGANIAYELISTSGPDHLRMFKMRVCVNGIPCGEGIGHSKQSAGQQAAKVALENFHTDKMLLNQLNIKTSKEQTEEKI